MNDTPAETTAPRRRSRRASAAVGEAVEVAVTGAPEVAPAADAPAAPEAETPAAETAPKKRVSRSRKKAEPEAAETPEAGDAPATENIDGDAAPAAPKSASSRSRSAKAKAEAAAAAVEGPAEGETPVASAEAAAASDAEHAADAEPRKRSTRSRSRKTAENGDASKTEPGEKPADAESAEKPENDGADKSGSAKSGSGRKATDKGGADRNGADKSDADKNGNGADRNGRDGQTRSSRTRQRERKRRGQGDDFEPEITEDDVLLPIAGILDVLDNYAFVRTSGYLPGTGDVYVSLGQVKKYGLRKGDAVVGAIRQPRDGEGGGRQKYNAIVRVDTVNSRPVDENETRADFAGFTPIHPSERLRLETEGGDLTQRVIDLFAPVGKGQRGLIVGPHESGKSTALRRIASAVAANQPDAHLMLVLVEERPEEVTELERTVNGEVIASTFDRTAEDHVTIAELAVERAKRLVELGHDVVLLIDSLTGLARAYNALAPAGSRVPAGSLEASALAPIKKLLGAARNIENGGSLTIVATASDQPGSRVDEAVLGELEAAANMQLRLSGEAADRRVYPAIDLRASSTRRAELLTSEAEAKVLDGLRRTIATESPAEALEAVLSRLGETSSNVEFLALAQRSQA
ncbi:MAG: transcription termination factor Rho [Leucobacter sp.]